MPTVATEDYLKAIYKLQRRSGSATNSSIAEELGVRPASVTGMVAKLVHLGLAHHTPYQGVKLSGDGEEVALEVLRHHRLVELYLTEYLGYPLDQVHAEAERLEHVISPMLEELIAEKLGNPVVDPHGDPIPTKEGAVAESSHVGLPEIAPETTVVVRRVSDSDPERLRYLSGLGLVPNAVVRVVSVEPFGGPVVLEVKGARCALGREVAGTIRVSRA